MKSISIIIPTKNRPQFLKSVLKPFKDFNNSIEVIVIDDGSVTQDASMNQQISHFNGVSHYHFFKRSQGAAQARNHGLYLSQGQWIWFVDDDDIVPTKTINDVLHTVNENKKQLEAILLPMTQRAGDITINQVFPTREKNNFEVYRHKGHEVNTSCALFLRKLILHINGWDNTLVTGQDTDLFLRVSRIASFTCLETEPIIVNVGHFQRKTRNILAQQRGKLHFLKKHWSILTLRRKLYYIGTFIFCFPCFYGIKQRIRILFDHRLSK